MRVFRDISAAKARDIDRAMRSMARLANLDELETRFIDVAGSLLPGDCLCWNNWSRDMGQLLSFRMSESYTGCFTGLLDVFAETVGNHPVLVANQLEDTSQRVLRLSDFQPVSRFRDANPLFREVYRHLDSHYQICHTAAVLSDRRLLLTWNRRALDFSDQDMQVFHYMGQWLGVIGRRMEERQRLDDSWKALSGFVNTMLEPVSVGALGEKDAGILAELLKPLPRHRIAADLGIRRDSLDKRLGAIRERLGLENHHQLLSALAELRNPASPSKRSHH